MKNKNIILTVAIVAIVGGFFLFNSFLTKDVADEDMNTEVVKIIDRTVEYPPSSVMVTNQISGKDIFIEDIFLRNSGYVVVHKEKNGGPGDILAVSEFLSTSGSKSNFSINIDEETEEGDILFAMLHVDDGDGVFNATKDSPAVGENGDVIFSRFVIVSNGTFEVGEKL